MFIFEVIYLMNSDFVLKPIYSLHYKDILGSMSNNTNLSCIGHALYNSMPELLLIAGLLLLVAMIGSIVLTVDFRYHEANSVVTYNTTESLEGKITYSSHLPMDGQNKSIVDYDYPK